MHLCAFVALFAPLFAATGSLSAQASSISMTAPGALSVSTATAGSQLTGQSNSTARYDVTIGSGRMKIIAHLDSSLPSGVTISIALAAPSGAVSLGNVTLTTSSQDVVRYINIGEYTGLTVTLAITASVNAGVIPYDSSHVVLTLVADP